MFKALFKDITTCKDGQSYDVVRFAMTIVILMLPAVLVWGLFMLSYAFFHEKSFDLMGAFTAVGTFLGTFGAFLMSGAAALYFKKTTEPNNEHVDVKTDKQGTVSTAEVNRT